jgi:hypothetical protein
MQTGSEQLKSQQKVMQARNFYQGKIDGIWGPKTIAAKVKWERSGKFAPAIPNNGFPLADRGPFPIGVRRQADGTLSCSEIELSAQLPKVEAPVAPPAVQAPPASVFPTPLANVAQSGNNDQQRQDRNKNKGDGDNGKKQ